MTARILVVDEKRTLSAQLAAMLRRQFEVASVSSLDERSGRGFDIAIIAPGSAAPGLICRSIVEAGVAQRVIVLAQQPTLRDALRAIRGGASDFVPDGGNAAAVMGRLEALVSDLEIRAELRRLQGLRGSPATGRRILGESPGIVRLRERLRCLGASDITVLITGESGTGKELVARALHEQRGGGPFVAVSCTAVPRHLMESEFFGHARGAFTGAHGARDGLFVQANGGTILLDDVGEMPLELQGKLLRALQQRTVRPLGECVERPFSVRVLAASSQNLEQEIAEGRFRRDLYSCLNVGRVVVPPLRDRGTDTLLLAQHFIDSARPHPLRVRGLTPAAARALRDYEWPGNVRELEHCMLSALGVARHDHISRADLPANIARTPEPENGKEDLVPLREAERRHILETLRAVGGNKALASRSLGLDRKTLYRKLRLYAAHGPERRARSRLESHPE